MKYTVVKLTVPMMLKAQEQGKESGVEMRCYCGATVDPAIGTDGVGHVPLHDVPLSVVVGNIQLNVRCPYSWMPINIDEKSRAGGAHRANGSRRNGGKARKGKRTGRK